VILSGTPWGFKKVVIVAVPIFQNSSGFDDEFAF